MRDSVFSASKHRLDKVVIKELEYDSLLKDIESKRLIKRLKFYFV